MLSGFRFLFDVEACCGDWRLVDSWLVGTAVSRAVLECDGCGQQRMFTVTSKPALPHELRHQTLRSVPRPVRLVG